MLTLLEKIATGDYNKGVKMKSGLTPRKVNELKGK